MSTAASAPAPAAIRGPQPRPYRDFLTPSLHRRFTSAALIGLALCWLEAILLSKFNLFWSWFPISLTGVRTLLLFISSLSVFILRVAQMHFGEWSTTSSIETLYYNILSRNIFHTLFWYIVSAFVFSEVYILSTAETANLAWIDPGRSYERPRLNERPVLLRTLFFVLAIIQSARHLYCDYDYVSPPRTKHLNANPKAHTPHALLRKALHTACHHALRLAAATAVIGPVLYFMLLRPFSWSIAFRIGRTFFSGVSKSTKPAGVTGFISLIARFVWSGFLLALLWEVSNVAFSAYTAREPIKKGNPLTADSKDPNGSLIAGLRAKKEIPRTVAFWELDMITAKFDERRVTIYQDVDRKDGSAWSQISQICLSEIQSVIQRIEDSKALSPAGGSKGAEAVPEAGKPLPKIASGPIADENIFGAPPPPRNTMQIMQQSVGDIAKNFGQSPGPNPVSPRAQKLLEYGKGAILSKEQQEYYTTAHMSHRANGLFGHLIRSPVGEPFRRRWRRQVIAVVFGVPRSNAPVVFSAVHALCHLVVCSLKEDRLGQVQKDIATIIRLLVSTIEKVEILLHTMPCHWTDATFNGSRRVKEVDGLLTAMRTGLEQILLTFGEYAQNIGLSRAELRLAKEVAAQGPEMVHARQ